MHCCEGSLPSGQEQPSLEKHLSVGLIVCIPLVPYVVSHRIQ